MEHVLPVPPQPPASTFASVRFWRPCAGVSPVPGPVRED
nr:hypothetical protein Iba_chr14bCG3340 [Ipomoea batatas]